MPTFGTPLARYRAWSAVATFSYLTYLFIRRLWHDPDFEPIAELHALLYLVLVVGLVRRTPAVRAITLGLAAFDLYTSWTFYRVFHHPWPYLILEAALVAVLVPWSRRDLTLSGLGLAALGAAWDPILTVFDLGKVDWADHSELCLLALPLFLYGGFAALTRRRIGSLLLAGAGACVYFSNVKWALYIPQIGAVACVAAAALTWPGTRDGRLGRLHAFAA